MGYLRSIADELVDVAKNGAPVAIAGTGVGALLSDKEDVKDKLKTGLVTAGAGVSAGAAVPRTYHALVNKLMEPRIARAESVVNKIKDKFDFRAKSWHAAFGNDRALYEWNAPFMKQTPEAMMESVRVELARRKAADKAQRIVDKVKTRHKNLGKLTVPLGVAAMLAGGYTGYNYMED